MRRIHRGAGTPPPGSGLPGRRRTRGQYLVEFSMAVIIFVMVAIGMIELALAAYNYRLMNQAAQDACRLGTTGATDDEMKDVILAKGSALYPTAFLQCGFGDPVVTFSPERADRVRGVNLTVDLHFFQGVSMQGYYAVKLDLPITASMPMTTDVFVDTDGDGQGDYTDGDDDNDGVADAADAYPKDSSQH